MSDCCNHNHHQVSNVSEHAKGSVYMCPMHPEIVRNGPGMCPECGMALVPSAKKEGGHNKHEGHSTKMFLRKFWMSLVLTVPIVLYSNLPEIFFAWQAPAFPGSSYLELVLGSVVFFWGGWIFLAGAWREIQGRLPGMMTLIGLAIIAAYSWSVYAVFAKEMPLFWELATLITVMLLGHWIEMKSVQGARGALRELSKLLPDTAEVVRPNGSETISIADLKMGDVVLVKPGGRIPADGNVVNGQSDVNESIITGESGLVPKKVGDEVIAGTTNGDGSLRVEVTKIGEHTFLAGVMRLVEEAQSSKSRLQLLSDKAALILTVIAVGTGAITLVAWLLVGESAAFAVARLVAVLVIACPHALGLAVPLVASISTNMAASNGFLVKQRMALEQARSINVVLFDKTGTLTKGEFGVSEIMPSPGISPEQVLSLASAVNQQSEHAIARAITEDTKQKGLPIADVQNFQRIPGKGAQGTVEGKDVLVGSEALLAELSISVDESVSSRAKELEHQGKTVIYVVAEKQLLGAIGLADIIREESREAVEALHKRGIRVAMITGDSEEVASWVAKELGIDEYFARVLPGNKSAKVQELQKRGLKVAMVGDGVNDAPALTQADVGIAIGAGTNVAIESAGIILMKNDPRDIPKILRLSQVTYRKMIQNLFWATGYNILALPLAAGVLYTQGVVLDPAVAAVFMSISTVIVAFNALLLRRTRLT